MGYFTVAALLLGYLTILASAQSDRDFEFTDSRGQCWRCAPGMPCERCNSLAVPPFPTHPKDPLVTPPGPWPDQCVTPNCDDLRGQNKLSFIFPSTESRKFYQCMPSQTNPGSWVAQVMECPCDTLFDYKNQRCEFPWVWRPHCRNLNIPVKVQDCPTNEPTIVPTDPTEPTTVPTTTDPNTTTKPPCVCIPWWPCACNPCWNFPCMSCNGCMGK